MKKFTAIILALVMALTLAACGNGGGISQAEYDRLQRELDKLQNELDGLKDNNSGSASTGSGPYASAETGDVIQFGGNDWRVLDVQGDKALILSDRVMTVRGYHTASTAITWAECDIREYLNGQFIDDTFTTAEKAMIAETRNLNKSNQWNNTAGGIDTIDKVFLLSIEEVVQYFGDSGQLSNKPNDTSYIDDEYNSRRIALGKDNDTACWWWLRSPGVISDSAASVSTDGSVGVGLGWSSRVSAVGGVRPALWLNL